MNKTDIFAFDAHRVRTATLKGAAWFVAADVCRALDLKPANGSFAEHLEKLDADEVTPVSRTGVKLPGTGMWNAKLISEPGLYKLIAASNKPEAKRLTAGSATRFSRPSARRAGRITPGSKAGVGPPRWACLSRTS